MGVRVRRASPSFGPAPSRAAVALRRWWPETALGVGVVVAILGPVLRRGFVLRYDLVFVPDPPFGAVVWGSGSELPRAVPSELLAVGLSQVVPADVAQKVLLAGCLVLAAVGAARLAPVGHPLARVAAGLAYVWNPWVYGRLHLGQWAVVAGFAALPWAFAWVLGVLRPPPEGTGPGRRSAVAGGAAVVLGGPAMVLAAVFACAPVLALARRWRAFVAGAATLAGLTAPWWLALLSRGGAVDVDERGVAAFAVRADTPLGVLGSVATLGGVWSRNAVPVGRDQWAVALIALTLAGAALWGYVLTRRRWPSAAWWGLLAGAVLGTVVAVAPAWSLGAQGMVALVEHVPLAGAVRDGTRLLAPLALVQAVGLGMLVESLVTTGARALAPLLVVAPVLLMPGLAWGLGGQFDTVRYPAEWAAVRAEVNRDPAGGTLVSLPWSSFRAYPWAGNVPVLDPASRAFRRPVVGDQDVLVGRDRIRGESREADRVAAALAAPGDPGPALRRLGVRYVLVQTDQPDAAQVEGRFVSAELVRRDGALTLLRLPDSDFSGSSGRIGIMPVLGYSVLGATLMIALSHRVKRQ
ncbi:MULTISPECIES: hypothetical protein [unclassified Micromonospora]|uniref:hypothetical protein n=1 Tax=unclassified Micromonospora TaxID=2617518 RepID=UPI0003EEA621|nr:MULTISPECIES: hypothetical protein [unclassified Micromonospora]EWM66989.1 PE-PGRS family protein [Micromonospora sp. M42]MCK1807054.1 DUF3367 domain-containing protein [Micromonospora sp. R42106]MCK1831799.1 DUF3367 domain-containing protein [Micromonospora sp. R42003]MCK1844535.1 DUF3367 domain-containing protein [Micromonospora sp. R42004]MCM1016881.1 DUF3367 domain-containing protein [Micromonospora sp. XM-20-01]